MALIRFIDGTTDAVTSEVGANLWGVLSGDIEPTKDQAAYCERVKKVFLNWRNAPDSYIKQNFGTIAVTIIGQFMVEGKPRQNSPTDKSPGQIVVDYKPRPTRPEPSDTAVIEFCRKWGLIDQSGFITKLGLKYW